MRILASLINRFFLLLFCSGYAHAAALPQSFTEALAAASIPLEAVSLIIQPLNSREPMRAHRATDAMNPASVMKVVTSLAALDRLGPAFTWKTELWAQGAICNRTLSGDLIIKGYGDPTLTLERLWLLQRDIKARGIDAIHGNLILDASYFELPKLDAGALDGAPLAMYNALPGALLANYNATTLKLSPADTTVAVTPDLRLPDLTLTSRLVPDNAACVDWQDRMRVARGADGQELIFEGSYARSCGEKSLNLNVYEPAQNFDRIFRALWMASGGIFTGDTRPGCAPDTPPLLRFESIPLAEALRSQNKYSNNLMTRNLFLTLGAATGGAPATPAKAEAAVRAWLSAQQIAAPELVLENGAGLSRSERISAQTLGRILQAAATHPLFSEFESTLPILGVDGTLRRWQGDSPLAGRAHLKTGTLKGVRALAGYVMNRDDQRIVFVLLINHANADGAEAAQRALLEWTYATPASASR